jgi:hypothetical protein
VDLSTISPKVILRFAQNDKIKAALFPQTI